MSWIKENGLTIVSVGLAAISAAIGIKQKDVSTQKAVDRHFEKEAEKQRRQAEESEE